MILVTGAKGFIGSKLNQALRSSFGLDYPRDICDFENYIEKLSLPKFTGIIHLASISNVSACNENPTEAIRTNVLGTTHLLEFARKNKLWFMNIGSRDAGLVHLYGISKFFSEILCEKYSKDFGIPVALVRLSDVVGEGMSEKKALPTIVRKANDDEPIIIKNPNHIFNFVDVDIVVDRILEISKEMKELSGCKTFVIQGEKDITLKDLVEETVHNLGSKSKIIYE